MRTKFTDRWIAGTKAATKRADHTDAGCPGLVLRVTPNGVRTFAVAYRNAEGANRRLTLGRVGDTVLHQGEYVPLTLAVAHEQARQARARLRLGQSPTEEAAPSPTAPQGLGLTVGALVRKYLAARATHMKASTAARHLADCGRLGSLATVEVARLQRAEVREWRDATARPGRRRRPRICTS